MEKFAKWIEESEKTQAQIAAELGVSQAYVSQVASGKKRPSADLMARVCVASDGVVRMEDWYPALASQSHKPQERVNG